MKKEWYYLFLLGVFAVRLAARAVQPGDGFIEDLAILTHNPPMYAPAFELGLVDPIKRSRAQRLFSAQMKALSDLRRYTDPAIVPILIEYLGYTTDIVPPFAHSSPNRGLESNVAVLRTLWPAFDAILTIPGSADFVAKYVLDLQNPFPSRMAAFQVLRDVDLAKFRTVAKSVDKEALGFGPNMQKAVQAMEDGSLPYAGILPLEAAL